MKKYGVLLVGGFVLFVAFVMVLVYVTFVKSSMFGVLLGILLTTMLIGLWRLIVEYLPLIEGEDE